MAAEWVIGAAALCLFSGGGCFSSCQDECYQAQPVCSVDYACQPQGYGWQAQSYGWQAQSYGWQTQGWQAQGSGWQPQGYGRQPQGYAAAPGSWQGYGTGYQARYDSGPYEDGAVQGRYTATYESGYDGYGQSGGWNQYDAYSSPYPEGYGKSYRPEMSGSAEFQDYGVEAEVDY